jgi:peptidoglycan hydrolase-like protein with peptidoglycan-binding domain
MRNTLRRISFGVLGTGMIVAMTAGAAAGAANAAVASPHHAATHQSAALSWPAVKEGAKGERVRTIQYLLNQRGYKVTIDGTFGTTTEAAVVKFQKTIGVSADGIVGSTTWPKLVVTVKAGSKGDAVRAVQHSLRYRYGYTSLKVDGTFGTATTTAVKGFQTKYKLTADGIVGVTTWNALVVNEL